jgi:hypothetical protein
VDDFPPEKAGESEKKRADAGRAFRKIETSQPLAHSESGDKPMEENEAIHSGWDRGEQCKPIGRIKHLGL